MAMENTASSPSRLNAISLIFVSILLLSFHFFFVYFVNSTYVSAFVGDTGVSFVYAIGAILNISLFLKAPKLLRRYGLLNMTTGLALLEIAALVTLAFPTHPAILVLAFFAHTAAAPILIYCMDMFLEQYGPKEETGAMRGMFLTMWNVPPIITPFIAGLIIGSTSVAAHSGRLLSDLHETGFWKIYLISAAFLIPFIIILRANFRGKRDLAYPDMNIKDTILHFLKHKNIFDVFVDRILLNLYFAWNVVYLPIYLHEFIGFSWNEVGVLISVMLLPFVLLQGRIGKMQDQHAQEKPLLIAGFLIIALGTIIQPFIVVKSLVPWAIVLFITHIGASFVEVSSESYFFKHVSPTNSGFISLFRMTRTLPYIVLPPIITLILAFLPFGYMFLVLGLIMLLGIRYAFLIR